MTEESSVPEGKKLCECGCGELIPTISFDRQRRFKHGHNSKLFLNNNWKGGRCLSGNGYVLIKKPEHPRARNGYVFEHILVLEKKIGRALLPGEDTHHVNGIKTDNRPENLQNLMHGKHVTLTNKIDMSDRICVDCGSKTTVIERRKNRPSPVAKWFRADQGGSLFRCRRCHRRNNKSKQLH